MRHVHLPSHLFERLDMASTPATAENNTLFEIDEARQGARVRLVDHDGETCGMCVSLSICSERARK